MFCGTLSSSQSRKVKNIRAHCRVIDDVYLLVIALRMLQNSYSDRVCVWICEHINIAY
jgi:hypothetical protein